MTRPSVVAPAPAAVPAPARPRETPGDAPDRVAERRLCARCGGIGTHYLTCPSLRLPADRRHAYDAARDSAPAARRGPVPGQSGGPDHPDWPRPPRH